MPLLDRRSVISGAAAAIASGFARPTAAQRTPRLATNVSLGDLFRDAGTAGAFAALDLACDRIVVSDSERAGKGFLPASTFKIANALIALETGVAADADNPTFPWDGVVREFDAWNRDHTLRTAFRASSVPTYQHIARTVGAERMRRYVDAFDYGNRDISGAPLDTFWLNGKLRISAMQQLGFLSRLYREELPVSKRSQEIVKDIMFLEQSELGTLRGKTGAVGIGVVRGSKATLGWLVGWLEHASKAYIFALNIDVRERRHLAQRLPMVKAMLRRAIALGGK
jgi:beta-lactamase class D